MIHNKRLHYYLLLEKLEDEMVAGCTNPTLTVYEGNTLKY